MTFAFKIYIHFIHFQQKSCISFAIEAKPLELYVPPENNGMRYHIWRLVTSGPFENIIMLLIIGNTILLMLKVIKVSNNEKFYIYECLSFEPSLSQLR